MMANASAKTRAMIIAVNILGAAEGFLPSALILARLEAAKTAHGPIILNIKIIINAMYRLIFLPIWDATEPRSFGARKCRNHPCFGFLFHRTYSRSRSYNRCFSRCVPFGDRSGKPLSATRLI